MTRNVNILDSLPAMRRQYFTAKWLFVILVAWLAFLLSLYFATIVTTARKATQAQDLMREKTTVAKRLEVINTTIASINKQINQNGDANVTQESAARRALIDKLQKKRIDGFSAFFNDFASAVPPGVWLTGFSVNVDPNVVLIDANASYSHLIPVFISNLAKSKAFKGTGFSVFNVKNIAPKKDKVGKVITQGYVSFELKTEVSS